MHCSEVTDLSIVSTRGLHMSEIHLNSSISATSQSYNKETSSYLCTLLCPSTGVNERRDIENRNGVCFLETSLQGNSNTQEII